MTLDFILRASIKVCTNEYGLYEYGIFPGCLIIKKYASFMALAGIFCYDRWRHAFCDTKSKVVDID